MIRIKSKHKLRLAPTNDVVFVETTRKLYRYIDGGWIEKLYFSVGEIAEIIPASPQVVREAIRKLNLRMKSERSGLTHPQVMMIARSIQMRKQKKSFEEIRKELL